MRLTICLLVLSSALAQHHQSGQEEEKLRRKCAWLAKAQQAARARPGLRQHIEGHRGTKEGASLVDMCAKLHAAIAYREKEAMETKCAWLERLQEAGEGEFLQRQSWYPELADICEGVPKSEQADNRADVLKQQCVWIAMAEASGKIEAALERSPVYRKMKADCDASPTARLVQERAREVAAKLQGAMSMLNGVLERNRDDDGEFLGEKLHAMAPMAKHFLEEAKSDHFEPAEMQQEFMTAMRSQDIPRTMSEEELTGEKRVFPPVGVTTVAPPGMPATRAMPASFGAPQFQAAPPQMASAAPEFVASDASDVRTIHV